MNIKENILAMTYNGLGYDFVATSNCDASEASRQAKGAVEIS
jgi:hypothetical protein